ALLQDLAAGYGTPAAVQEADRARRLHSAAFVAYDGRPGGREVLGDRLDVMLREQRYAAERQAELGRMLAGAATREDADALRLDLAWAHDDHERAVARCAELRYRMSELDRRTGSGQFRGAESLHGGDSAHSEQAHHTGAEYGTEAPAGPTVSAYDSEPAAVAEAAVPEQDAPAPLAKQRKRRRGGARFAGMVEEGDASVAVPQAAGPEPVPAAPAASGRRTPRGARFAGAGERAERKAEPQREALDAEAREETVRVVERLVGLRREGRSGEAHALLVELAYWPAARIPLLAAELRRAGLDADWTTLLWEAASLPADRLVAAADALAAVGRTADGEQILRQGVARPAGEIGQAVLDLARAGRRREARALLDAYVRVRTPEEAARSAAPEPRTLIPLLLESARAVSEQCRWDLVHALRVAGFTA
ncbi:hypothetical protein ACWD25_46655, partial [Streptomyces sp. NPDC002920]